MQSIADKLADVAERIAECERDIASSSNYADPALAALMLDSAASTLSELRIYKARLEHLIAVKAPAQQSWPNIETGAAAARNPATPAGQGRANFGCAAAPTSTC